MKRTQLLALTVVLPALAACSWVPRVPGMDRITGEEGIFRDRQGEYLQARTIPRTEIPQGMDGFIIDDLLVIPEINAQETQAYLDAPRPRPLEGRTDREVVIQRMQNRSWIVVDVSPSEVWPRIRDYWRQDGVDVAMENPTAGIMDTAWFVKDGNVLNREKFRVLVDTGFQDNSSEIRLLHLSAPQATPVFEQVNWPESSVDPEIEFEVLNDMSTYLADVADLYQASSVSFLAGNIASSGKATIVNTPAGEEILQLQADFQRSWAAVGRSLTRAGVEIVAQDADAGVYDVRYVPGSGDAAADEEEEPGFFKKVVTLNGLFSGKEDESQAFPFRVQVQDGIPAVNVRIVPDAGAEAAEAARELLRLIRNTIA
jgi:outer membrane protein assembly factor BamC